MINNPAPISVWSSIEEFVNYGEGDMREFFDAFEFKFAYMR